MKTILTVLLFVGLLLVGGCKSGQADEGPSPSASLPAINGGQDPRNPTANANTATPPPSNP